FPVPDLAFRLVRRVQAGSITVVAGPENRNLSLKPLIRARVRPTGGNGIASGLDRLRRRAGAPGGCHRNFGDAPPRRWERHDPSGISRPAPLPGSWARSR